MTEANSNSSGNNIIDVLKRQKLLGANFEAPAEPKEVEPEYLAIPEIDELTRRLSDVQEGDFDQARFTIRSWLTGLNSTAAIKPVDQNGQPRRRYIKEVDADEVAVLEWVKKLDVLFDFLANQSVHLSLAHKYYNVEIGVIANWKDSGLLRVVGREKNRVLLNEKDVAIASAIYYKFGGHGRRVVRVAVNNRQLKHGGLHLYRSRMRQAH